MRPPLAARRIATASGRTDAPAPGCPAHRDRVGRTDVPAPGCPAIPCPGRLLSAPWKQRYREEMLDVLDSGRAVGGQHHS